MLLRINQKSTQCRCCYLHASQYSSLWPGCLLVPAVEKWSDLSQQPTSHLFHPSLSGCQYTYLCCPCSGHDQRQLRWTNHDSTELTLITKRVVTFLNDLNTAFLSIFIKISIIDAKSKKKSIKHVISFCLFGRINKFVFLEVVTLQILQFLPILRLLVVIHTHPLHLLVTHILVICTMHQSLQIIIPIQLSQYVHLQTNCVLHQTHILLVYLMNYSQCVFILFSVCQNIPPFQQYSSLNWTFILPDLFGIWKSLTQTIDSIHFRLILQISIRHIKVIVSLII